MARHAAHSQEKSRKIVHAGKTSIITVAEFPRADEVIIRSPYSCLSLNRSPRPMTSEMIRYAASNKSSFALTSSLQMSS